MSFLTIGAEAEVLSSNSVSLTIESPILILGLLGLFGLFMLEVPRLIEEEPPLDMFDLVSER